MNDLIRKLEERPAGLLQVLIREINGTWSCYEAADPEDLSKAKSFKTAEAAIQHFLKRKEREAQVAALPEPAAAQVEEVLETEEALPLFPEMAMEGGGK